MQALLIKTAITAVSTTLIIGTADTALTTPAKSLRLTDNREASPPFLHHIFGCDAYSFMALSRFFNA